MELQPQASVTRPAPWAVRHVAGLVCAVAGVAGLALTAWWHFSHGHGLADTPDVLVPLPFLVVASIAGLASLVRREGARVLPLVGVGMAASAMVVGIALVLWAIAFLSVVIILILSEML